MDMLSNWWGGKPEKKISEEKIADQDAGGGEAEVPTDRNDDSAPASEDTTLRNDAPADTAAGQGKSSPATDEQPSGDNKETADNTKVNDETEKAANSENKEASAPLGGLTKMTKEEAAEAAEAALNSAYNFGSFLFKKVSDTASKTANMIQKTVEEQTIVGEFSREQQKFVKEKHSKRSDAAVPPWVGYNEEEQMKEQILALSQDKRNFMRNPPAGVQFHFDYNTIHPIAMATLQEDPNLQKMRFALVPKKISEENFWRNYFYRVSLIKQSSQLTSLASKSGDEKRKSGSASHSSDEGSSLKGDKTPPITVKGAPSAPAKRSKSEEDQLDIETPDSPPGSEFISDAFNSELDEDDLMKGMEQLGMDKKGEDGAEEEVPEWEKELQQELQDYEVVGEEQNEEWEREINQMLDDEVDKQS
ncbi:synapse-associated protein 1 [Strongylocentrotus purpuratus]|uniref:BSD domain-containing protein n=1 Tax=Strongylocentrotus purpuratus TaxID=7668 RepID=A0A7M7PF97_STRPU|nr:synapse-associated protein 1 [Strongylocentrotus purpuratus]